MASLYQRDGSPFYWVKYRDPAGKVHRESTLCLVKDVHGYRKAREILERLTARETHRATFAKESAWTFWVVPFLEVRHANAPRTLQRNLSNWSTIAEFLTSINAPSPMMVTRTHCLAYVPWRQKRGHLNSPARKKISVNTIILELKTLSKLLNEALARGWIASNPCVRLGMKRVAPREKAEFTDEQIATVRAEIQRRQTTAKTRKKKALAQFYHLSFEIALHQCCRRCETNFDLDRVDFENLEVQLHAKGDKYYVANLNPALIPLLQQLKRAGRRTAYDEPVHPNLDWMHFFRELRKRDPAFNRVSFHSLRVTGVSRLERANVPQAVVMNLVNHASTTVHRVYRKVRSEELKRAWAATAYPAPALGKRSSSGNPGAPRSTATPPPPSSSSRA